MLAGARVLNALMTRGWRMSAKFQQFAVLTGLVLLIAFSLAPGVQAQPKDPIVLTDDRGEYPLGLHLEILKDPTGELTIEQVSSPEYDGRFTPSQKEAPKYGFTDSAYWVRFRVRSEASSTRQWRLELEFPNMQYIDIYRPLPDQQGFEVKRTGILLPFDTREVAHHHFIFNLFLPTGTEQTIYLRFKSDAAMNFPLTIWSPDAFFEKDSVELLKRGFIYGILVIMMGYNMFLFFSLREVSYLYYVLLLAAGSLFLSSMDGLAARYIWPNLAQGNRFPILLFIVLGVISLLKFTSISLATRIYAPKVNQVISCLLLFSGLFVILIPFVRYDLIVQPIMLLTQFSFLTIFVAGLVTWRRGYHPAHYFLLTWLVLLVIVFSAYLVRLGFLPNNVLVYHSDLIGAAFTVLLLSLVLADRINVIKEEKAQAETEALRVKAENARIEAELDVTRQLQQMLLPSKKELAQLDRLDIAGFMEPAEEVGGDYYDVLQYDEQLKIGIGDVTGHGLESGMVMLMLQTAVRTLLISGVTGSSRFLNVLNRVLYDNMQRMDVDKSLSLTLLDSQLGQMKLNVSGQHEQLLIVRQGGEVEMMDTLDLGFPLGLEPEIARFVEETSIELQPGDGIVLYSDGITEAENVESEFYGLERLCDVVSEHWAGTAEAVKDAVVADVRAFIGEQTVYDDLTLLVVKQR